MNRLSIFSMSALAASLVLGCGGSDSTGTKTAAAPGGSKDPNAWPADDRSMCKTQGRTGIEVSEIAGQGAPKPNVRRVYRIHGEGVTAHRSIECREIDTNLDGIKDLVRTYEDNGAPKHEEADRNYDGRIDLWIDFVGGHVAEESLDTNGDGRPDVWKFYTEGALQRIRRDRNYDGQPDLWEIYNGGRLERVGTDETFDGHVDRWDRDDELKRAADVAEQKARAELEGTSGGGADAGTSTDAGGADASGPSPTP